MRLPALPADYPLFDWDASNGSATAEQTQKAYTAIRLQGLCADFSRFVWNDLSDLLSGALDAAGLGWDSKYGTAEDTQIQVLYGQLTAARFNAVRYNLSRLFNPNWPWAVDKTVKGYLGREDVRGVSTHDKQADIVYGWYIEELAAVLNILIQVLRNDDTVLGRLSYGQNIQSLCAADALAAKAALLGYLEVLQTKTEADLFPAVGGLMESKRLSGTSVQAEGQSAKAEILGGGVTALTSSQAGIYAQIVSPLGMRETVYSIHRGRLSQREGEPLELSAVSASLHRAAVKFANSTYISIRSRSESRTGAGITKHAAAAFDLAAHTDTKATAAAETFPVAFAGAMEKAKSVSTAPVAKYLSAKMLAAETLSTAQKGALEKNPPAHHLANIPVLTRISGLAKACKAGCLGADTESATVHLGAAQAAPSAVAAGKALSGTQVKASAVSHQVQLLELSSTSDSAASATMGAVLPTPMGGEDIARSVSAASVFPALVIHTGGREKSNTRYAATALCRPGKPMQAHTICGTRHRAALTLQGVEITWWDPVQTGSNVYIRSAEPQWQEGSNVCLWAHWIAPVQDGNNVYIRSAHPVGHINDGIYLSKEAKT